MCPTLASASSSFDQHRGLRWIMKDDDASVMNSSSQDLREMMQLKVGSSQEPRRSSGYDLNSVQKGQSVSQSFGSLEGLVSLNQTQAQETETRHFIDAFANEAIGNSLALSMAGEEEQCRNEAVDTMMMGTNRRQWMCHEGLSWLVGH